MKIVTRIEQQTDLITGLVKELEVEKSYRGIERLVQLILQALLDLGLMVISALGGKTPERYSDIGEVLSDMDVLSRNEEKLLRSMAGMRNILVHAYADIRRDLVANSVDKLKDDAIRISRILRKSLEGKAVDPQIADETVNLSKVFKGRVEAAFLFGGRAKGYSMKGDYDVAVYFGRHFDLYELGGLLIDIAEALNISEDQIDLISLDSAPPKMIIEALKGKIIFMEDDYALFKLRLKASLELLDMNVIPKNRIIGDQ